jgi:hypothetical protein
LRHILQEKMEAEPDKRPIKKAITGAKLLLS